MIYDCFLFNDEFELLKLRLNFLDEIVDYFVIVESNLTFTQSRKKLHFTENKEYFKKFQKKIIHLVVQSPNSGDAWNNEFHQREYIKQGLLNCNDEDLVIISDLDEIPNLYKIIPLFESNSVHKIKMTLSYYFLNTVSDKCWEMAIIGKYRAIKNINFGNRNNLVKQISSIPCTIKNSPKLGWHLSYLFGFKIDLYFSKIKSFSHTEYDNEYILDNERIHNLVYEGLDLFERDEYNFRPKRPELIFTKRFLHSIEKTKMLNYLFPCPGFSKKNMLKNLKSIFYYYLPFKYGKSKI